MKNYELELLDPNAKGLLDELVRLNLIRLKEVQEPEVEFKQLLSKLRTSEKTAPSLEEIEKEVKAVRKKRYAKGK